MFETQFIKIYSAEKGILRDREVIPSLFPALRDGDILHTEHVLGVPQGA